MNTQFKFHFRSEPIPIELAPPEDRNQLSPRATPKRQNDFFTGRYCAREALKKSGASEGSLHPLIRDKDGVPTWPAGFTGSITHTSDFYAAIVAKREFVKSVGIDAELLEPLMDRSVISKLLPPGEIREAQEIVAESIFSDESMSGDFALRLLFSIRESIFKALFPVVRQPILYRDVQVRLLRSESLFTAASIFGNFPIQGKYGFEKNHVLSFCSVD